METKERICVNGSQRIAEAHAQRRRSTNRAFGALVISVLFICAMLLVRDAHPWAGAGFFATGILMWLTVAYD